MLPPFHIRNLWSPPKESQETLVRINAPYYDDTISHNPAAALRYYDEDDGDLITLGSSRELTEKLEEPHLPPSSALSADLHHRLQSSEHHVFEINDLGPVRKLWQDIQQSGRDSHDNPIPQDLGDGSNWSSQKKNSLAVFYERRKREIWSPLAEELGLPWQSIDLMHWVLGKEELTRRAHGLIAEPEHIRSIEETFGSKADSSYYIPATQSFEEYRLHHFNATAPPRLQLPMPITSQPTNATTGQAAVPSISNLDLDRSELTIVGKRGETTLTVEGKRQAQAAGDKLRARTTLSRHRKAALAVDGHQNRWASYKSSTSAFLPKASTSVSQAFDGPGLTSEGRRQAQVAGDKLRCRTNPIRHLRPSRVGSSEHAISKNRWSSYSGTRATRFDERQDAQEEAGNTSNPMNTDDVSRDGQPSLLEVFETELAKKISSTDRREVSEADSSSVHEPVVSSNANTQPLPQSSHAVFAVINEHLQELTAGDAALSQDVLTAIDHGVRTAATGFGACIQGIARGLQEVSLVSRQAAIRTRDADLQLMDDATLGFQRLAAGLTTFLRRGVAADQDGPASPPRDRTGEVAMSTSSTKLDVAPENGSDEGATYARMSNESPLNDGVESSEAAYSPSSNHAAAPRFISDISASPKLGIERQVRLRPTLSEEPPFYGPGPVSVPNRLGNIDRVQQSQSVKTFDEEDHVQRACSPPVNTHFPTLAEFEGEISAATPGFPALPGMEPLIPERASRQPMFVTAARESGPANGSLSCLSSPDDAESSERSHDPVIKPSEHSTAQNGSEVIPLSCQSSSCQSSAARLAGPFDPMEAEPSARPDLTRGLRRNATVASADIRHAARLRRPYSEGFDGSGRVAWGAFLQDSGGRPRGPYKASDGRGMLPNANQQHSKRLSRREVESRCSLLVATEYDDQHQDDSTVGKVNDCVEQLRELGFGEVGDQSAARLLVYAQAAEGVLVDAIDLIDEEQRAYRERL